MSLNKRIFKDFFLFLCFFFLCCHFFLLECSHQRWLSPLFQNLSVLFVPVSEGFLFPGAHVQPLPFPLPAITWSLPNIAILCCATSLFHFFDHCTSWRDRGWWICSNLASGSTTCLLYSTFWLQQLLGEIKQSYILPSSHIHILQCNLRSKGFFGFFSHGIQRFIAWNFLQTCFFFFLKKKKERKGNGCASHFLY